MIKLSLSRVAVAVGGLALALSAGAGVAAADPVVDTTCSYGQLAAALNAQDPNVAAAFNASPQTQAGLRQFLAAGPDQRATIAQQIRNDPSAQPYIGVIEQAFNTCNNF